MVKVKLEGLKIARSRGKYYVYHRATGEAILRGFAGDKEALARELATPGLIGAYNAKRKRPASAYPEQTLGWLVAWFTTECPEFKKLADVTQGQYKDAYNFLEPEFDIALTDITQAGLYDARDKCSKAKWPRFADKMMTALSSMFKQAVRRGKMPNNPAIGVERIHKYDPNSNREWRPEEWVTAFGLAPLKFKIPFMLARYPGFRGQTIVKIQWNHYQPDPAYGKCFRLVAKKNAEQIWVPAKPEIQSFLDGLTRTSLNIATKHNGQPWKNEKQMQTAVSNWLKALERKGLVGEGLTLHGLRVTYAAGLRRDGAATGDVAAALGDRDERMGAHYTRHVENEARVVRAFGKPKKKK